MFSEDDVIFKYTRAQAMADGVLVDLSQYRITGEHWKLHVACTAAVWLHIHLAINQGKDINGILHDIYLLGKIACAKNDGQREVQFKVSIGRQIVTLKLHIGPGDKGEPVLTLMMPDED